MEEVKTGGTMNWKDILVLMIIVDRPSLLRRLVASGSCNIGQPEFHTVHIQLQHTPFDVIKF
jgi:hypothetical protein